MASRPASVAGETSLEPLKAWIANKEEYLRKHGRPAPLTDEERRALAVLVPPPTPAAPPPDDGDLGDTDWVSLLMPYKGLHVPPTYTEEQAMRTYSNSPLWRYRCQIREAPGQWFPAIPKDGTTSDAQSDTGFYVRKKDARQFAARSACKWLMANHCMPSDGKSVVFGFGSGMKPAPNTGLPPAAFPVSQALPSKRPFSETSLKEMTTGQQGHLGQLPPQSPSPSQSSQSSLHLYVQQQQQQQHIQPPSLPAALIPAQHIAEPVPTINSLHNTYPATGSSSSKARVQSIASWKRPRSNGSIGSSSSSGDDGVPPASGGESSAAAAAIPTQGLRKPPTPRIHSNGRAPVKAKLPIDRLTANFEEITKWERLQMLCRLLKAGQPKEDLKPGFEGAEGIFSGRITLVPIKSTKTSNTSKGSKDDTAPMIVLPPGVGEVQDVHTRKAAREKAAQSVLDYLQNSVAVPRVV